MFNLINYREIRRRGHKWILRSNSDIVSKEYTAWLESVDSEMEELFGEEEKE